MRSFINKSRPQDVLVFDNLIVTTRSYLIAIVSSKYMETNYKKQAEDFLAKYNLTLNIRGAVPQKRPLWCKEGEKHGINYFCSLVNKKGKAYSFDYWGSIADAEAIRHGGKHNRPSSYDILACLDTYSDGETFEDFCSSYGYDTDSRAAEATYNAVMKQISGLKSILSAEAIEELNEIQ